MRTLPLALFGYPAEDNILFAQAAAAIAVFGVVLALVVLAWRRSKWLGALVAVVAYTVIGLLIANAGPGGCFQGSGTC